MRIDLKNIFGKLFSNGLQTQKAKEIRYSFAGDDARDSKPIAPSPKPKPRAPRKVNVKTISRVVTNGSITLLNGKLIIDGEEVYLGGRDEKNVVINIRGNVEVANLSSANVTITGNAGDVSSTSGNVTVNGSVTTGVSTTSGDVSVLNNIGGDVQTTSGDVSARSISGSVSTVTGDVNR